MPEHDNVVEFDCILPGIVTSLACVFNAKERLRRVLSGSLPDATQKQIFKTVR